MAGGVREHSAGVEREQAPGALGLVVLLAGGVALGLVLWTLEGPPTVPDWAALPGALSSSAIADANLAATAATVAWLVLGYLAISVGARLLALLATGVTGGARWARAGLRLSNLVTIPSVRRLIDGGVAGTLLAASWLPLPQEVTHTAIPAYVAAASPVVAGPEAVRPDAPVRGVPVAAPAAAEAIQFAHYTVAAGDDLWGIARRSYGDGTRFVEIWEANRERLMAPDERFTDPRLIRPGWVLSLPLPLLELSVEEEALSYRVRPGDHLWGIAERWLGDGFRWVEIWERNQGHEMGEGRRFSDPNLLAPGWQLELPVTAPSFEPWPDEAWAAEAPPAVRPGTTPAATAPWGPPAMPGELGPTPGFIVPGDDTPASENPVIAGSGAAGEWPRLPRATLLSAAGFAVIGGVVLFVRALRPPRLPGGSESSGGEPGDAARVALTTGALARLLTEGGFPGSLPLLVHESGRRLEFTVSCRAGDAEALAALADDIARRFRCGLRAVPVTPTRVLLTLSGPRRRPGLLAEPVAAAALVVPVGATGEEIVYLNLAAAGSVTIAGTAAERRALLHSWLATLSTTCSPDQLSFRADAETGRLLEADQGLPHFAGAAGEGDAADLADELDDLIQRRGTSNRTGHPLVAIFDLTETDRELPGAAMRYGPAAGVFLICCLPPGEPADHLATAGVSISFGPAGPDPDDEAGGAPPGVIALSVGRDRPLLLDPVRVRRDTSPRWSESAALPPPPSTVAPVSDVLVQPWDAGEGNPGGGFPRSAVADDGDTKQGAAMAHVPVHPGPLAEPSIDAAPETRVALRHPDSDPPVSDAPAIERAVAVGAPGGNVADRGAVPFAELTAGGRRVEGAAVGLSASPDPALSINAAGEREHTAGLDHEPPGPGQSEAAAPFVPESHQATSPDGASSSAAAPPDVARAPADPRPAAPTHISRILGTTRQAALFTHADLSSHPPGASGAQPLFTVRCLGAFELRCGSVPIDQWPREKSRELLAFLATHGGAAVLKESVAGALWPDYPWDASVRHLVANAASSLRSVLRAAAGDDSLQPITTTRQRCEIRTPLFSIDLDAFESALRRAHTLPDREALDEYERAVALYRGDFLEGEFLPWLDSYRRDYLQRLVDAAHRAAAIAEQLAEHERAAWFYSVILEHEDTDEAAARGLMRQFAAAGEVNGARRVFKSLTLALQRELDDPRADPTAETRALLAELVAGEGAVPA